MIHDYQAIKRIVEDVMAQDVADLRVVSVQIQPPQSDDDSNELGIRIMVSEQGVKENARRILHAMSNIRSKLYLADSSMTPVFSFGHALR